MPLRFKDGLGNLEYIGASGNGSIDDPFNLGFSEENSADILTDLDGILTAVNNLSTILTTLQDINTPNVAIPKAGTVASTGDNILIVAPGAGFRIVLVSWSWWNESSTDTTAILKSTSINPIDRYVQTAKGLGKLSPIPANYVVKLAENEALVLNLSDANSHGYSLLYYTEAV